MLSTTVPHCVIYARQAYPDGTRLEFKPENLEDGAGKAGLYPAVAARLMAMKFELGIQHQIKCSFILQVLKLSLETLFCTL